MKAILKGLTEFWKKILTIIRLSPEKPHNIELFKEYYNKIALCNDFNEFVILNDEISKLSYDRTFEYKDEVLLRQALRIKNYEFNIMQIQNDIGMLQMSMVLNMNPEALDPFSKTNVEAKRTEEYEKIEDGEIHQIKDVWKPEK